MHKDGRKLVRITLSHGSWAALLSLFIHLIIIFIKYDTFNLVKRAEKEKLEEKKIRVVLAPKKEEPKQIRKRKVTEKKKQVVENENKEIKEKPIETRFLSEHNQIHKKQSVSKNIGAFKKAGKGDKTGSKVVTKNKVDDTGRKGRKHRKKISLADVSVGESAHTKERHNRTLKALGLDKGLKGETGLSRTSDYIDDVPLGEMTKLNTTEFKYYGFYHRIKQKLEQYWSNTLREKADTIYRSGRKIASGTDLVTALLITIDRKGNIVNIRIKGTSGVQELDEAAVESFNKAGPFPNPPTGMLVGGRAKIEWGFVVKS